jgi:hypothetical protein
MKKEKTLIYLLLASITASVLIPFINTGLVEGDDAEFFITAMQKNFSHDAVGYAKIAGRFYFLITKPFYSAPYLINNLMLSKTINVLLVVINILLISAIVKQLFKNRWLNYLTYLLIITFIVVKGENNPILSFTWYFTSSFALILLSIFFALKYGENKLKKYKVISIISFSIGLLFYEVYLLYLPLVIISAIQIGELKKISIKNKLKKILNISYPYIIIGLIYVGFYMGYRFFYPSIYEGTSIAGKINFTNSFNAMLRLSKGAYPTHFFFSGKYIFYQTSHLLNNHFKNIGYLLKTSSYLWYIKAVVTGVLFYMFTESISKINIKKLLSVLAIALIYVYIPQLPLAVTQKYCYHYTSMNNYITTFFGLLSFGLLLSLIFTLPTFIKNKITKQILIVTITLFVSLGSIITDYINYHAVVFFQQPLNTLNCMNKFIQTDVFASIPDKSFVYSPNLYSNKFGYAYSRYKWGDYTYYKTGKKISFAAKKEELLKAIKDKKNNIFYLKYDYNKNNIDQFITFGQISKKSIIDSVNTIILTDSITCFFYSAHKDFSISFAYGNNSNTLSYIVNNQIFTSNTNSAINTYTYKNIHDYFKPIKIKAKDINMESVNISDLYSRKKADIVICE